MPCLPTCFHGLARALLMCAYAVHVYLLSWLYSCLACVCICYACTLNFVTGLVPRQCMHMLSMSAYSQGLARASPAYACAMHVHSISAWARASLLCAYAMHLCLLSGLSWCLAYVCICHYVVCMYAFSCGLALASLLCAYAMHVCLLLWLGLCLADVYICYACPLTFMAQLVLA